MAGSISPFLSYCVHVFAHQAIKAHQEPAMAIRSPVAPPITASFHSNVGIFTPLLLNNYHVRIAKLSGFGRGAAPRVSHLRLKPQKQVVQLLAARPHTSSAESTVVGGSCVGGTRSVRLLPPTAYTVW